MDYKDKLKLAKEALDSGSYDKETIEYIFPELAESEDEKIRKELIEFVKSRGGFKQEYIAWLEKQGEQKPVDNVGPKFKVGDIIEKKHNSDINKFGRFTITDIFENSYWYNDAIICDISEQNDWELVEQKPTIEMKSAEESLGIDSETYNKIVDECIYGDDKQKPVNNIEPKFKVGDYLVNDYCKGKVIALTDDAYLLDTERGIPFSHEHNAHLWTIADAKEGDVLVGKIDGDDYILIFKQIKDGWIETYGHYYDAVDRFCVPSQLFCKDYKGIFYPATKEQRDLLFQKMKDAGYEWDAEKKELRKIDARKNLTLDGDLMQADCMIVEQNQTWSEEDERILDALITSLNNERFAGRLETLKGVGVSLVIDWLKSLKEKIKKEAV